MAYYTFKCNVCGEFTEWHRSTKGNKQYSTCPTCDAIAKRVFKPPIVYRLDKKLKHTIEKGKEPQIRTKEQLTTTAIQKVIKRSQSARPWQVS